MLITRHFVFVHHQKTGGMFVKGLFKTQLPDWIVDDLEHVPASAIPAEHQHLPVLGFVRNPWDWYVSWYSYVLSQRQRFENEPPNSLWVSVLDRGRASFQEAVTTACGAGGVDLYTRMHRLMFDRPMEIGRFENLRGDLLAFLERHSIPAGEDFVHHALTRPAENATTRDHYSRYYDAELRELVANTSPIVREYGYSFEPPVAS